MYSWVMYRNHRHETEADMEAAIELMKEVYSSVGYPISSESISGLVFDTAVDIPFNERQVLGISPLPWLMR